MWGTDYEDQVGSNLRSNNDLLIFPRSNSVLYVSKEERGRKLGEERRAIYVSLFPLKDTPITLLQMSSCCSFYQKGTLFRRKQRQLQYVTYNFIHSDKRLKVFFYVL